MGCGGNDAHSWVQAYLPHVGWVSFDPTPTFAPNAAPSASAQPTAPPAPTHLAVPQPAPTQKPQVKPMATAHAVSSNKAQARVPTGNHNQGQGVLIGITVGGLVLALLFFLTIIVRYWWRRFYESNMLVSVLFWRCCQIASWVGLGPKVWQTPTSIAQCSADNSPNRRLRSCA